jgi:hypothetical protein
MRVLAFRKRLNSIYEERGNLYNEKKRYHKMLVQKNKCVELHTVKIFCVNYPQLPSITHNQKIVGFCTHAHDYERSFFMEVYKLAAKYQINLN